jgi:hypothetical protein
MKRAKQTKGGARKRRKAKRETTRVRDKHAILCAYSQWLFYERKLLAMEMHPGNKDAENFVPMSTGFEFHFNHKKSPPPPSTRAAKVLAFLGASLRDIEKNSAHGVARITEAQARSLSK